MSSLLLFSLLLYSASGRAVDKITLQLAWLDQFQFAGYYMAKEKGFYRDAGLDVTLKTYQEGIVLVDEVLSDRADYGIGHSSIMIDRLKGTPIVALAAIFQSSPNTLLALKDSGIKTIQDIKGKRIMISENMKNAFVYRAMFSSQGISFSDMKLLPHSGRLDDLIEGKTDLMASYVSNEPYILQEKGIESIGFTPRDYGFNFYDDILFTTEEEIAAHPERTRLFLNASIRGWEYAFEHIDESVDIIREKYNSQNKSRASLVFEAMALKKLAYNNQKQLGNITINKFKEIYNLYRVMEPLDAPIEKLNGFVYQSFLNSELKLTAKEKKFLSTHEIQVISTDKWAPFNYSFDNSNMHTSLKGISYDLWMEIAKRANIRTKLNYAESWEDVLDSIKHKKADITFGTAFSKDREAYAIFSKPYDIYPNVIATRDNIGYIGDLSSLNGKRVAVGKGYTIEEELREYYPEIEIIPAESTHEAIKLLASGEVFAVIDILPVLSHALNTSKYKNLKISGTTEFDFNIRFMIRKDYPELLSIIDKTIDTLSKEERKTIFNRYMTIPHETEVDYSLISQLLLFFGIIIVLLVNRQKVLKKHNEELLQLTITDKLTQLYNRVKLDESLDEHIELYHRYRYGFSVILIDIDHFKMVNDTYGHLVGDRVLIKVADILKKHLRLTDILGRWGGEEFMIICPETDQKGAILLAESLRSIMENSYFEKIKKRTCSFGVSVFNSSDTVESIIKRVDDALYEAKRKGRNRVVFR